MAEPPGGDTGVNTHTCPGGCGAQVPNHLFACLPDWRRLPNPIRHSLITAYNRRDTAAHRNAMAEATHWYHDHPK